MPVAYKVKLQETGRFHTMTEAAELTGLTVSSILYAHTKKLKKIGEFHILDWAQETTNDLKKPSARKSAGSHSMFVRPYGRKWGVFYKDELLKIFKTQDCANAYALDSALDDIRKHDIPKQKITTEKTSPRAQTIRHIETGKIYSSILEASEDLGISNGAICKVLNGQRETVKGQHFERIKEETNGQIHRRL